MKLIDLLVQELPKLGGWPDGAEYARVSYFGVGKVLVDFRFPDAYGELSYCIGVIARNLIDTGTDVDYHMIRHDSYESALSASQKPAWNGEGFPPVGCECEWQDKNIKQWQPVKVVYASEWVTVVREINKERGDDLVEVAIENYGDDSRLKFRPLRTEAERKRDAAIEKMIKIATIHTTKSLSLDLALNSVYNAIAAGKIPGVKLDD